MKLLFSICLLLISTILTAQITYLPLGDSYTICEGLKEEERWPNLVARRSAENGVKINLTQNPSRTGYTTFDLIKYELPLLRSSKPDLVTLLIGVNDYVQGLDTAIFHKNLDFILDEIEKYISNKKHIILITIPDYSVTPQGVFYAAGRDVTNDLKSWNKIIEHEAKNRGLGYVDIFPLTRKMKEDKTLISEDGLHPSAKEVALWAEIIYPELQKILGK